MRRRLKSPVSSSWVARCRICSTARVSASQAYQHCARNNIQVHGGMGFTWAFDCHLHYRRANLLALQLGALSEWEDRLVGHLVAKREAASNPA